jgi:hypothetical protein
MYHLAEFYNSLDYAFLQLKQLEFYSKDLLVPALASSNEDFYDTEDELKTEWKWYIGYHNRLIILMKQADAKADSLEIDLQQQVDQIES